MRKGRCIDSSAALAYVKAYVSRKAPGRRVKLFKNGRNQAVRIPREFELPGPDAHAQGGEEARDRAGAKEIVWSCWRPSSLSTRSSRRSRIRRRAIRPLGSGFLHRRRRVRLAAREGGGSTRRQGRQQRVCTSIIVAAELRYGASKKGSPALSRLLEAVLEPLDVVALEPPVDAVYGELRAGLDKGAQRPAWPMGASDRFIAG